MSMEFTVGSSVLFYNADCVLPQSILTTAQRQSARSRFLLCPARVRFVLHFAITPIIFDWPRADFVRRATRIVRVLNSI